MSDVFSENRSCSFSFVEGLFEHGGTNSGGVVVDGNTSRWKKIYERRSSSSQVIGQ